MARGRFIKPGIITNEELCELGQNAYILFTSLWMLADRDGRLEDRPKRIKVEGIPFFDCDVDELLTKLADTGFIVRYVANGHRYIAITAWAKHQHPHPHEPKSDIPAPNGVVQVLAAHEDSTSTDNVITCNDNVGPCNTNVVTCPSLTLTRTNTLNDGGGGLERRRSRVREEEPEPAAPPPAPRKRKPPERSKHEALAAELTRSHPERGSLDAAVEALDKLDPDEATVGRIRSAHREQVPQLVALRTRDPDAFVPNLARWIRDRDWDSAATRRKPVSVIEAIIDELKAEEQQRRAVAC